MMPITFHSFMTFKWPQSKLERQFVQRAIETMPNACAFEKLKKGGGQKYIMEPSAPEAAL